MPTRAKVPEFDYYGPDGTVRKVVLLTEREARALHKFVIACMPMLNLPSEDLLRAERVLKHHLEWIEAMGGTD